MKISCIKLFGQDLMRYTFLFNEYIFYSILSYAEYKKKFFNVVK